MAKKTVKIHINRRLFETALSSATGLEVLGVGGYGADYELYLLNGEGDPTGGVNIAHDEIVELRNGLHFRAIPGNANFG